MNKDISLSYLWLVVISERPNSFFGGVLQMDAPGRLVMLIH